MTQEPSTGEELADILAAANARRKPIELGGNFSKRAGAGPTAAAEVTVSTCRLDRILAYEPRDLTISVEAGMSYAELHRTLMANRQMIPLDPPFYDQATIGGVIASNSSGPRRRLYGTARDVVIGMKFATLEGKIIQSGGMVVKNVAGLDMGKLLIGSWGSLAAITSVNFKLIPKPAVDSTLLAGIDSPSAAFELRDKVIGSVLQPAAIDFINLPAALELGYKKALVAIEFGGNEAMITRCRKVLAQWTEPVEQDADEADRFWRSVHNFTPGFLARYGEGAVVRVSATLSGMREVLESLSVPAIARAGSGVIYAYFSRISAASEWMAGNRRWTCVIEYARVSRKEGLALWPSPGNDIEIMKRIKDMFDPHSLLNRGRYYGIF